MNLKYGICIIDYLRDGKTYNGRFFHTLEEVERCLNGFSKCGKRDFEVHVFELGKEIPVVRKTIQVVQPPVEDYIYEVGNESE